MDHRASDNLFLELLTRAPPDQVIETVVRRRIDTCRN